MLVFRGAEVYPGGADALVKSLRQSAGADRVIKVMRYL
jgi:hypothetical protein